MPIVSTGQISIIDVNDGTSPISVIMSNETCTVPANIGGTVLSFDNTGPTIKVYEGDRVLINPSSGQLSAGTWNVVSSTSDTNLGIPVAVIAANGESVTYPNIEYWSTGNAILTTKVVYTIEGITYTGKPFTVIKEQVITKAMQGSTGITGTAASYYSLEADVAVIKKSASGTLTPASITLKAFRNTTTKAAYSGRFKIYENSNTTASYTSTANESIKAYSTSDITSKLKAELYAANGTTTLLDTQEFLLVEDGSSSIIINVSNANYAIPTAYDGTVATYEGSGTSITVKEGITSLTYRTTLGTNASSFTVGTPIVSIGSITVGARSGDTTTTAILADHTNMGSSDVVTITYPITYNRANGSQATENVTQTITKSKQGVRGSRTLYASDAAYTSTYDYDGATTTYAAGLASYRKKATDIVYAATSGSSPRSPINGDTVTFSNNSSYVFTLTYDASTSTWAAPGTVIDGSLLVTGSVTASKINSNGLEIRDSAGTLILGAGTSNNLDFSRIGGATKPADNATVGATAGVNLKDSAGNSLTDAAIKNTTISSGQNLIPNSDWNSARTIAGCYNPDGANLDDRYLEYAYNMWGDTYVLQGTSTRNVTIHQQGKTAAGDGGIACDTYPTGDWANAIPVIAGKRYCFSYYGASHRCSFGLYIEFRDAGNNYLTSTQDSQSSTENTADRLSVYKRPFACLTAPANASTVRLAIRKNNTYSFATDSWLWIAAPQLEIIGDDANGPGPYTPGPAVNTRQLGYSGDLNATYGATADQVTAINSKLSKDSDSALSATVSVNAVTGAGFRAGDLTWDANGTRTGGKGVAMTPGGLVGHNGTKTTFAINATTGDATFGGILAVGTVSAESVYTFNSGTTSMANATGYSTSITLTSTYKWQGGKAIIAMIPAMYMGRLSSNVAWINPTVSLYVNGVQHTYLSLGNIPAAPTSYSLTSPITVIDTSMSQFNPPGENNTLMLYFSANLWSSTGALVANTNSATVWFAPSITILEVKV